VYEAPSEEIYDKSTQGMLKSTFSGLQRCRRFYIHSFSCCCLQNLRNAERFSQKFKLIAVQGHLSLQSHRSRPFPIGGPLEPSLYLQLFTIYRTLSIFGSRPWPFTVTWRHRLHDHLIPR